MNVRKKSFVSYTLLPGVIPRISAFLSSGFAFLAGLMAVIYQNIGLLPSNHAYLQAENYGRYGVRHVVTEAGRNLDFSRKHLDQIILYFLILTGIVLLILQFCLLGFSVVTYPVLASSLWTQYFVDTPAGHTGSQDMAFVILDTIFGIMRDSGETGGLGFFGSCYGDILTDCEDINGNIMYSPTAFPLPFHQAFHGLLHFYTSGIAFVAGLIIIYFIITIIGETVTSGTPFGKRFNKAWFVPRLIVFFALIAPISTNTSVGGGYVNNQGVNVAQLITLSVAKAGSNFATNVWLGFMDSDGVTTSLDADGNTLYQVSSLLGQGQNLVARPNVPDIGELIQFTHVVHACMYAEKIVNNKEVVPYIVRPSVDNVGARNLHKGHFYLYGTDTESEDAMGGTTDNFLLAEDTSFERAVIFSRYKDVVLRFGEYNPPDDLAATALPSYITGNPAGDHETHWGYVEPTCGEIHFEITSLDPFVIGGTIDGGSTGIHGIQGELFLTVMSILSEGTELQLTAQCMARSILPYDHDPECVSQPYTAWGTTYPTGWITTDAMHILKEDFNEQYSYFLTGESKLGGAYSYNQPNDLIQTIENSSENTDYLGNVLMPERVRERGWAGAAIWYNQIASINGMVASAHVNVPKVHVYPIVMEDVAAQHRQNDSYVSHQDRYNPELQNGKIADLSRISDQYLASYLYAVYSSWNSAAATETIYTRPARNAILDVINMILGTYGLYDILQNKGVHPLATLSGLGKSMVDAAVRNMFLGVAGQTIGALVDNFAGGMVGVASSFAFKFGMIGLSIGFLLYYILPLMPFIYFFFAFSGWIKSIFEAVVAMPLWAVAHIKIDGNGLPGPLATNGYFLLFEIFLRPVLIISGFILSFSIFAALINVLHDVFETLTLTAAGYDMSAGIFWDDITGPGGRLQGSTSEAGEHSLSYMRGPIDELFFTALYAMVVYMIGLSCFKLVDQIPNSIIRWMGATVSTFQEAAGFDPASKLSGNMYRSLNMTNAQITAMMERFKGNNSDAVTQAHLAGL